VNTLLLAASVPAVPDVIALAATVTNNGIVDIPGATGIGAFSVATANVGVAATITASADTGGAVLPLALTVCQTDATGRCLALPSASVTLVVVAGATPTFSVFAQGNGAIPFDPAVNRVYLRFKDEQDVIRGSTSVAIRTQQ
jgi:hypothetical protein